MSIQRLATQGLANWRIVLDLLLVRDLAWLLHGDLARLHVGIGSLAWCRHGIGNLAGLLIVDRLGWDGLDHHHAWLLLHVLSAILSLWIVNGACWNFLVVVGAGVALTCVLHVLWLDEGDVEGRADANENWRDPWRVKSNFDIEVERSASHNPAKVSNDDGHVDVCLSLAVLGVLGR